MSLSEFVVLVAVYRAISLIVKCPRRQRKGTSRTYSTTSETNPLVPCTYRILLTFAWRKNLYKLIFLFVLKPG